MSFKMNSKEFKMFAEYINKKAKGADITFYEDHQKLMAKFINDNNEQIEITFFSEEIGSFTKLTKSRYLSEEL